MSCSRTKKKKRIFKQETTHVKQLSIKLLAQRYVTCSQNNENKIKCILSVRALYNETVKKKRIFLAFSSQTKSTKLWIFSQKHFLFKH